MNTLIQIVGLTWGGLFVLALLVSAGYGWWEDRKAEKQEAHLKD